MATGNWLRAEKKKQSDIVQNKTQIEPEHAKPPKLYCTSTQERPRAQVPGLSIKHINPGQEETHLPRFWHTKQGVLVVCGMRSTSTLCPIH